MKKHSAKEQSTTAVKTAAAGDHFEIENARQQKKRELKNKQYIQYTTKVYGTPCEKEAARKDHREALLEQIKQKDSDEKTKSTLKVKESQGALAYDRSCLESDQQEHTKKANYLKDFRDGNKKLIEIRSEEKRKQRDEENHRERELLKKNPINWSNSLC